MQAASNASGAEASGKQGTAKHVRDMFSGVALLAASGFREYWRVAPRQEDCLEPAVEASTILVKIACAHSHPQQPKLTAGPGLLEHCACLEPQPMISHHCRFMNDSEDDRKDEEEGSGT